MTFITFFKVKTSYRFIWHYLYKIQAFFLKYTLGTVCYQLMFRWIVYKIRCYENNYHMYTTEALKKKYQNVIFKGKQENININDLILTISIVNELIKRHLKIRCRDVQILGSIGSTYNFIIESSTGEGKSIMSIIISIIQLIKHNQIHIITSNEYLVKRDYLYANPVFNDLGINTSLLLNNDDGNNRKKYYKSNVIFGTSEEFAFDYLKELDNSSLSLNMKHEYVLVDEIDSILLDVAQTPLILSIKYQSIYIQYILTKLKSMVHLIDLEKVEKKEHLVDYTDDMVFLIESHILPYLNNSIYSMTSLDNIYSYHLINQIVKAKFQLHKNIDYLVNNQQIKLLNKITDRTMQNHSYSEGLQHAIELKENLPFTDISITRSTITLPNYFKNYKQIGGFSGTLNNTRKEFKEFYYLEVLPIKKHYRNRLITFKDRVFSDYNFKNNNLVNTINKYYLRRQPLLVNFNSVDELNLISIMLDKQSVPFKNLNAKDISLEKKIIHSSGFISNITLSTNIISRGTDISFHNSRNSSLVKLIGGLALISNEYKENDRIQSQVIGRVARKNNPGESRIIANYYNDHYFKIIKLWHISIFNIIRTNKSIRMPLIHSFNGIIKKHIQNKHRKSLNNFLEQNKLNDNIETKLTNSFKNIRNVIFLQFKTNFKKTLFSYVFLTIQNTLYNFKVFNNFTQINTELLHTYMSHIPVKQAYHSAEIQLKYLSKIIFLLVYSEYNDLLKKGKVMFIFKHTNAQLSRIYIKYIQDRLFFKNIEELYIFKSAYNPLNTLKKDSVKCLNTYFVDSIRLSILKTLRL